MSKVIVNFGNLVGASELTPVDGRKNFYKKCELGEHEYGFILWSYHLPVAAFDRDTATFYRLWGGYSATTARHIQSFCVAMGHPKIAKAEWMKMPVCDFDRWNHSVTVEM